MSKYVLYLRKSREDENAESRGEGETLARHEKTLLALAAKSSFKINAIYKELVSGETISSRPVMQKLLLEVEQGLWDGVLVTEIERLARGDTIDQGIVSQAFKYSNTKIITPAKIYDPNNEFDEEYFEFSLFMSRREFKTINRRMQAGKIASLKEGKFIYAVAPYGYKKISIPNGNGFTLDAIPDEANVVKMIYNWYTIGDIQENGSYLKYGATLISRKLNQLGIPSRVKGIWTKSSIIDILKNHVYIGMIRYGYRREVKSVENGELVIKRPYSKDYDLYKGLHTAIIDEITFNNAQNILSNKTHLPIADSKTLKNPLTGLATCMKCNTLMTRLAPSGKTPYACLKCPNNKCNNISSPLELVERVLINELKYWLKDYKIIYNYEITDSPYKKKIKEKQIAIKQINNKLLKLQEQKNQIYTFLEQGIYDRELFNERISLTSNQIQETRNITSKLIQELDILNKQIKNRDSFVAKDENIFDLYYKLDSAAERNDILKEIIEKFEYMKESPNPKGERDNPCFKIKIYPKLINF